MWHSLLFARYQWDEKSVQSNYEFLLKIFHLQHTTCFVRKVYYKALYIYSIDVESKLAKFVQLIGTINRTIFRKMRTETIMKIHDTLVLPTFLYGSENWTLDSLTKTKNWSGRNEVTETSGRLHPLRPENKRLHTPRTTDYRHTRQDRWKQTELVSTLTKNATKPFEIIPLQTTRMENNWKTEETLERAVVTLETERNKGPNPWCLWWWWWWWWWFTDIFI